MPFVSLHHEYIFEYFQWNNQERKLKRFGKQEVILKRLENGESTNRNWFDEEKIGKQIEDKAGKNKKLNK
ncbi:22750_t:CDS:2 [Rhizophagus irregularis]|nr:22750_t:CDS:2 [Rhizophagus irregularis]